MCPKIEPGRLALTPPTLDADWRRQGSSVGGAENGWLQKKRRGTVIMRNVTSTIHRHSLALLQRQDSCGRAQTRAGQD